MKPLSKDARGFIDGVAKYMRSDARGSQMFPKVQSLFTRVTTAAKKERTADVATVVSLSESEKAVVCRVLEKILGHAVECRFTLDADLLGGMKITVADWVVDTSLSSQLAHMSNALI